MGQTELTVFLTLAATFGQTGFLVGYHLMTKSGKADYVITGQWAKKAHAEAARYGQANVVASSADNDLHIHSKA